MARPELSPESQRAFNVFGQTPKSEATSLMKDLKGKPGKLWYLWKQSIHMGGIQGSYSLESRGFALRTKSGFF